MFRRIIPRRQRRHYVLSALLSIGLVGGLAFSQLDPKGVRVEAPESRLPAADAPAAVIPNDFASAFDTGLRFMRGGDAHSAARAFEAARSIAPHEPATYANLGFAYFEMGQTAASRTAFEHAIEIAPMYPNSYFGLAEVFEREGDLDQAIGAMQTFVHLTPEEDPFRRRAMSAIWEWRQTRAAVPSAAATAPAVGLDDRLRKTELPIYDAPLTTLDGLGATLAEYRGRFVVLNVWAAWCGPCRVELPSLDRLADSLGPDKIAVIGVSIDRERAFTREFLNDIGIGFPNYWDGAKRLAGDILDARTLPLTVVIGPDGDVLLRYVGARDWSKATLVTALSDLAHESSLLDDPVARLREAVQ